MKRIDLLTFGSQIFSDEHLALPVPSYVQNTWETGIARTINTAIFMTQLLESQKNGINLSNCKFTQEEEKIYSGILEKISVIKLSKKISLSEYMLTRLKKQLTAWLSKWSHVPDEFPAKIKFQELLSMFLNSQNILAGSFPNYLLANPAPVLLESIFGMLRIEMIIQSAIMKSQKELDAHCELMKLLEVARDPAHYNFNPFNRLSLKQILKINSQWTGTFTEWAFGVPDALITLVEANQNPVFNSLVRQHFLVAESKIVKEESLLVTELAQEIKQHQDKIRQRFDLLKSKMSDTNEFNLDEYHQAGAEQIQKLEKYQLSLSSPASVASAFIKTFLSFHEKNFPTWGEFNQKPLQENKNFLSPISDIKLPQTPKGISGSISSSSSSSLSSGDSLSIPGVTSTVIESLNPPLTVSTPLIAPVGESIITESSKVPEKSELSGQLADINNSPSESTPAATAFTVQSETINTSTTTSDKTLALEKKPSTVKVASIPPSSSLAKRASIFQQTSAGSGSSTVSSVSSTPRENKSVNPKFNSIKEKVSQTLIQTTKNKGFIGSGTTASTTNTSSSSTTENGIT